ncbi:MAG: glycosyltransferase family protein [Synergistaceae bacterium]|jgi:spore coat polysaccharide biosynthesis protein SpsF|nr:glycosyltransferase family protein [Synergistaceae bacterium]
MRTIGIIQARMTSTRLPGKILMEVLGKPLLQYELERVRKIKSLDRIVVATTMNASDDPVADFCETLGQPFFRGSEMDVLSRFYETAAGYGADAVVRFTADCPLIDPDISERAVRHYLDNKDNLDYCAVDVKETPRPFPRGTDTEAFSMRALAEACREAVSPSEREHVTLFIYNRLERYRAVWLPAERDLSGYRLTVDTPEDFELIRAVIERLYPINQDFRLKDVIELLDSNPDLSLLNATVKQKTE